MTNLRTGREFDAPTVTRREAIRGGLAAVLATGCAPWVARRADGGLLRGVGARLGANFGGWANPYDFGDGSLIAMWDGEWNAGIGKHDGSLTTWKDLAGGYDLHRYGNPSVPHSHWAEKSLEFDGTVVGQTYSDGYKSLFVGDVLPSQDYFSSRTVHAEFVLRKDTDVRATALRIAGGFRRPCAMAVEGGMSAGKVLAARGGVGGVNFRRNMVGKVFSGSIEYSSGKEDFSTSNVYANAVNCNNTYKDWHADYHYGEEKVIVGTSIGHADPLFDGGIYCVRLYSRALSASEVLANFAEDAARFGIT